MYRKYNSRLEERRHLSGHHGIHHRMTKARVHLHLKLTTTPPIEKKLYHRVDGIRTLELIDQVREKLRKQRLRGL